MIAVESIALATPPGCKQRPAIDAQPVTASAADRLRLAPGTTRGANADEYLLRDGRVLVQAEYGGEGAILTAEAFKQRRGQLLEDLRFRRVARGESFHVLRGLIDDGASFAGQVPSLLTELHRRLVSDGLDLSASPTASLAALDQLASQWREGRCRPDPAFFRELTASLGELLIKKGGKWGTRESGGPSPVVEPVVELAVAGQTRTVAPWEWVDAALSGDATLTSLYDGAAKPSASAPTVTATPAVPSGADSDNAAKKATAIPGRRLGDLP